MKQKYYKILATCLVASLLVPTGLSSVVINADDDIQTQINEPASATSSTEKPQSTTEPSSSVQSEPIESSSSLQEPEESSSTVPSSMSEMDSSTSSSVSEKEDTDTTVGLTEESSPQESLYRLYNAGLKVHLYTKDTNEYKVLATRGWRQEGVAWQTSTQEGEPVYRLYHSGLKVHLYTKDTNEYKVLAGRGWRQEGVAYRSYGDIPVYRLYHPGLTRHLYTTDANEYRVLGTRGWRQEGGAFYGMKKDSQPTPTPAPVPSEPEEPIQLETTVTKVSSSHYQVVVKGVPDSIETVLLPIWFEKNGQDDIRWYTATKQADGSYSVDVPLSNHRFDSGKYHVHIYAKRVNENKNRYVGATSFEADPITRAMGHVSIQNINSDDASFEVLVSDVFSPKGIKSVLVPVWSNQDGQDDIQWYTATKQSNGTYKVRVDLSKHQYVFEDYTVHAYIEQNNGTLVGIGATQTNIPRPKQLPQISASYQGTGAFQLTFKRVLTSGKLRYAVWSETGGQDDIRWYEASRTGDTSFSGWFNAQDHKDTGRYNVHVYQEVNGQLSGLATTTVQVNKASYSAPYFSQLDGRWSGNWYGSWTFGPTGCVPTVMAMIISGVKGMTVTPDQVGGYLHYNTLEFNRLFLGTSSRGVVLAARNWGLKTSALNSYQDLETALKRGYYVAAGVGSSKFILAGGHEIVLKGYQNGMTYVLDPYNPGNNGWTSISYIWNVPSTDPIDRTEGMPFIKVTD